MGLFDGGGATSMFGNPSGWGQQLSSDFRNGASTNSVNPDGTPMTASAATNLAANTPGTGSSNGPGLIGTPPTLPGYLLPNGSLGGQADSYAGNAVMPTGPSPWMGQQASLINQQTQQATDAARQGQLASTQGAMDSAASHGGVTGGGAARIAAAGEFGGMQGTQNAAMQGAQNMNQAGITDMQTQLKNNQFNTQQQNQNNQFNAANDINAQNYIYGQQNNAYMGANMANAMGATGNGNSIGNLWGLLPK